MKPQRRPRSRVPMETVSLRVTPEEKEAVLAEAEREGVTVSVLLYRRIFNAPDAHRHVGRPPRYRREQDEELFAAS